MWGSSAPMRCRSQTRRRPWCRAARGPGRGRTGRGRSSRRACLAGARWPGPPPPAAARCRDSREPTGMPGSGSWEIWERGKYTNTAQTMECHRLNTCHPNLLENRTNTRVCVDNVVRVPNNSMNKDSQHCIVISASTTEQKMTYSDPSPSDSAPLSWHRNVIFPWSIHQIIIPSSWVIQFKCTQAEDFFLVQKTVKYQASVGELAQELYMLM